jgi:Fe-S cluster biogenesis protein NfuA
MGTTAEQEISHTAEGNAALRSRIESVLGEIRPFIQMDGGNIRLVEVRDGVVKVALTGACEGCAMAAMTLKAGVAQKLRQEIPEIKSVEAV